MEYEISFLQKQVSSVWPEWRITRRLGKGTFGAVYEILRNDLGHTYTCALKVLRMDSAESEEELEEFEHSVSREIDVMMQLKGAPHIVSIEDYKVLRDPGARTILIRMEELESVDQYVRRTGGMQTGKILQLGIDICRALESCERQNIIHRDIKLSNLFFSEKGGFKLGDFGISRTMESIMEKMSMSGAGTMQYMAPEVYHGARYDNKVDLYSLGIALYILLNGNLPPLCAGTGPRPDGSPDRALTHEANMRRLAGVPLPPPAHADARLASVICKACAPDPGDRFRNAAAFRTTLQECLEHRPAGPADLYAADTDLTKTSIPADFPASGRQGSLQGADSRQESSPLHAGRQAFGPASSDWQNLQDPLSDRRFSDEGGSSGGSSRSHGIPIPVIVLSAAIVILLLLLLGFQIRRLTQDRSRAESSADTEASAVSKGQETEKDASGSDANSGGQDEAQSAADGGQADGTDTSGSGADSSGQAGAQSAADGGQAEGGSGADIGRDSGGQGADGPLTPGSVEYTVSCWDEEGASLGSHTYTGIPGKTVTIPAPAIEGYTPDVYEQTFTLSSDRDNTIVFTYTPDEEEPLVYPSHGTASYNGHTYYIARMPSSDIPSFDDAAAYAADLGGCLAVINDAAENTFLYDFVFESGYESAYFGLTDAYTGYWLWVDGTASDSGYENWLPGQPDNQNGKEHYALFWYQDTAYTWNDGDFGPDTSGYVNFLIEWDQ